MSRVGLAQLYESYALLAALLAVFLTCNLMRHWDVTGRAYLKIAIMDAFLAGSLVRPDRASFYFAVHTRTIPRELGVFRQQI